MSDGNFIDYFLESKAILNGHFILSSGLHSDTYIQCARVLMDGKKSAKICDILAKKIISKIGNNSIDLVVSPAIGGMIVGYEIGKQLGIPSIFCERESGKFKFRRGFEIPENAKILVVEDVITTGKSSIETFDIIKENGGTVIAEACLVNRCDVNVEKILKVPVISLIDLKVKTFDKDNIPQELINIPASKPGSRFITK